MKTASDFISAAASTLGQHELPPGSNVTTFGKEVGLIPAQWCMQWVSHVMRAINFPMPADAQHPGKGWSSVGFFGQWASRHGYAIPKEQARPGDVILFEWEHDSWPDHVGIYVVRQGGMFKDIEGNSYGPDKVGDEVAYHLRSMNQVSKVVRLPLELGSIPNLNIPNLAPAPRIISPYPHLTNGVFLGRNRPKHPDFTAIYQRQMAKRGWKIGVDGIFGPESEKVTKQFQAEKGLQVDGVVGPQTWKAAFESPVT